MSGLRRFFLVGWNNSLDFALYCDSDPTMTVSRWLELVTASMNAKGISTGDPVALLKPGEDCLLFDWGLEQLPSDIRVNQVPKPGVVFAIRKGSRLNHEASEGLVETDIQATDPKPDGQSEEFKLAWVLKRELWRGEGKAPKRLQAFLAAPEANFEPLPITRFDAFISCSTEDMTFAKEIASDLEANSMRTFLASRDVTAGTVWTEEIRQSLLASRVLLVLLTPRSISRPWVMCEVGASWALGKPLIPALLYVDPKSLPEIITAYQCRKIETSEDRKALFRELANLCLVGNTTSI